MGLDIYHHKICTTGNHDRTMTLTAEDDGTPHPLQKYAEHAIDEPNTYIDWVKTFEKHGYPYEAFSLGMMSGYPDPPGSVYTFYRRPGASADLPEKLELVEHEQRHDLVTFERVDKALPYIEAGYQRKSVLGEFYDEFAAWEIITDRARVERIHALTVPEVQEHFKQEFLDNWEEGRSFVIVWY